MGSLALLLLPTAALGRSLTLAEWWVGVVLCDSRSLWPWRSWAFSQAPAGGSWRVRICG